VVCDTLKEPDIFVTLIAWFLAEMASVANSSSRVAIVGGGIAGLTAAFKLRALNPAIRVELFEASERLGGAIRTESVDGYLVEHGADMFATEPPAALELCRELGIESELLMPLPNARGAAIVHDGKLVKIPDGFVLMRPTLLWPMMRTPLLSFAGKLRLLAEPLIRRGDAIDESIESFVTRRLGHETLERIVQPLVGGIYTGDVAQLGMSATMPQFWEMERRDGSLFRATWRRRREGSDTTEQNSAGARYEKFRSFPQGMERLISELSSRLEKQSTHLSSPVRSLQRDADGWWVAMQTGVLKGPFDHVILATPAKHAATLLADTVPAAIQVLSEIRYASSAVVVFGVRDVDINQTLPIAGFVVPIREGRKILAVSFTGDKFAGRAPSGHKLIRVFIGGELQKQLLKQSDNQLVAMANKELEQLIGLHAAPIFSKVIRWNDAMPQYHVGHLGRLAIAEAAISQCPGLSMIGNSLRGVGIAPTVATAIKAARTIVGE